VSRAGPGAPEGVRATGVSPERADVAWLDALGETGYSVERKAAGGSWAEAAATGTNICMVCDTELSSGTSYAYRVTAGNDLGVSEPSATATAVTCPALPAATGTPKDHLAAAAAHAGSGGSARLLPGRFFAYQHDGIGNRQWAVLGVGEGPTKVPDPFVPSLLVSPPTGKK